jgi:hypothetical protein
MKKKAEVLRLKRETVVKLEEKALPAVNGGVFPSGAPSFCNYCIH